MFLCFLCLQLTTCNIKRERRQAILTFFNSKSLNVFKGPFVCVCLHRIFFLLKLTILHKYFNCFFLLLLFLKAIKTRTTIILKFVTFLVRVCMCLCCVRVFWFLNLFIVEGNFCEYRPSPLISQCMCEWVCVCSF